MVKYSKRKKYSKKKKYSKRLRNKHRGEKYSKRVKKRKTKKKKHMEKFDDNLKAGMQAPDAAFLAGATTTAAAAGLAGVGTAAAGALGLGAAAAAAGATALYNSRLCDCTGCKVCLRPGPRAPWCSKGTGCCRGRFSKQGGGLVEVGNDKFFCNECNGQRKAEEKEKKDGLAIKQGLLIRAINGGVQGGARIKELSQMPPEQLEAYVTDFLIKEEEDGGQQEQQEQLDLGNWLKSALSRLKSRVQQDPRLSAISAQLGDDKVDEATKKRLMSQLRRVNRVREMPTILE